MATIMEMPKLSDTMKEGAIGKWLVKEGDKVQAGVPIVEIETDKATMEYESPGSGTLLKILVADRTTCNLSTPIAVIGKADENWQEALEKYNAKKQTVAGINTKQNTDQNKQNIKPQSTVELSPETNAVQRSAERTKASPLAKKIAADKGIALTHIQGTGPNGRIVLRDIEDIQPSQSGSVALGGVTIVPLSMMRKTIASRLTESVNTAPHFYLNISVDVSDLFEWRKQICNKLPDEKRFSVNDLIIGITARALKKHPYVNASWQREHIALYTHVHMGMAVALPSGLITPVIKNADTLSVVEIGQHSKRLVKLAREGKLQPEDYNNGTFTISNLGMQGIESFTAIINPPQAAILAVGAAIPTPVVSNSGSIEVQTRMHFTLSCDHRVIDGAIGADFLKTLKDILQDPTNLLL